MSPTKFVICYAELDRLISARARIRPRLMNSDLENLAGIVADWIEPAPAVPAVYFFGSRMRGDHRPQEPGAGPKPHASLCCSSALWGCRGSRET